MNEKKSVGAVNIIVLVTYIAMVVVNALANILPINGINTGQVSDSYKNLFAPAGITFSIWGLIYLLLAIYSLYQLGLFKGKSKLSNPELLNRVGIFFLISSIANVAWIFSWHYKIIPLSLILMILILICLININKSILGTDIDKKEKFFVKLPFSIYFGWITVATIANATTLFVSIGWNRFGISDTLWTIAMLLIGMFIGVSVMLKNRDIAYGLVLVWAYVGILIKHMSLNGFAGEFPSVINAVIFSLAVFVIAEAYILVSKNKE